MYTHGTGLSDESHRFEAIIPCVDEEESQRIGELARRKSDQSVCLSVRSVVGK
jgi:hypothetical protein